MEHIKEGDIVELKSGGPPMTVNQVGEFSAAGGPEDGVHCVWFNKNDQREWAMFRGDLLQPCGTGGLSQGTLRRG